MEDGLSWMIGGPQGSGVDSAATMMGRACAHGGLWVFGKREYHSNIIGMHSYFQVRLSDREIRSHVDRVDLLATFDEETLFRHADAVVPGGAILYDPAKTEKALSVVRSFQGRAAVEVHDRLQKKGLEATIASILLEAKERGIHLFPFAYSDVLAQFLKDHPDVPSGRLAKAANTMAVAASLALIDLDIAHLEHAIGSVFATKKDTASLNVEIARAVYAHAKDRFPPSPLPHLQGGTASRRLYLNGTQAVAIGKLLGGCRFQTYYPITPASDESEFLETHEVFPLRSDEDGQASDGGIVVIQTEDEISAIAMATGAGLTGVRSATSTSGPGFSLMAEGLGWAGMNEVPVVVTLYQRAGPSTGLPTRHEQGDLQFALHAGHGEFPRIVLASGDMEECVYDAVRCHNYAERYQTPVIHLVDKALANSNALVRIPDSASLQLDRGRLAASPTALGAAHPLRRFDLSFEDGISPRPLLGDLGDAFWHTGDEHDPQGHIDEDPENRRLMMEKRAEKLNTASREIPATEKLSYFGPSDAETVLVSWGSTKGAILDTLAALARKGISLGFLQVRLLSPFPTSEVSEILGRARHTLDVEVNYSAQLAGLITEKTGISMDRVIVKFNGRPVSQDELASSVELALGRDAPKRIVMTHGS
jgi:2-oxoglutarate ferredoxin oxidoreductase subunit alpha